MKIETKFNSKDIVYFLTVNHDNLDDCNRTLKTGELFVVKGEVGRISITGNFGGECEVVYEVYINVNNGVKTVNVHEDFCAPNPTQLGVDVTYRYYLSGEKRNDNGKI